MSTKVVALVGLQGSYIPEVMKLLAEKLESSVYNPTLVDELPLSLSENRLYLITKPIDAFFQIQKLYGTEGITPLVYSYTPLWSGTAGGNLGEHKKSITIVDSHWVAWCVQNLLNTGERYYNAKSKVLNRAKDIPAMVNEYKVEEINHSNVLSINMESPKYKLEMSVFKSWCAVQDTRFTNREIADKLYSLLTKYI